MDTLTKAFFVGLTDELAKLAGDDEEEEKEKKGLAALKEKMAKKTMSIKEKIQAAKVDPSTKANPRDTGPRGSGLQDPRAQAMKGRGFGKEAWGGGKAKMQKGASEAFISGFESTLKGMGALKKRLGKALGKNAATAIPKSTPGAGEARRVAGKHLKHFQGRTFRKTMDDPKGKMSRSLRGTLAKMYGGSGKGK